jgi:carbonic anhydrase
MKNILIFLGCLTSLFSVTPKEALDRLTTGNQHYVDDDLQAPDRSSYRRGELVSSQKPFAAIVGCSDSRVPPEIIFDQGLGDLFVVRVAGPAVGPIELDSIEYSVRVLGASLIFVLGHESCGAVTAVLGGNTADIEDLANLIQPAVKGITNLEEAIKANVRWTVDNLKKTPLIKKYMKAGKLDVVGGYYNLEDGRIEILNK